MVHLGVAALLLSVVCHVRSKEVVGADPKRGLPGLPDQPPRIVSAVPSCTMSAGSWSVGWDRDALELRVAHTESALSRPAFSSRPGEAFLAASSSLWTGKEVSGMLQVSTHKA
jgi:hypothetical protein